MNKGGLNLLRNCAYSIVIGNCSQVYCLEIPLDPQSCELCVFKSFKKITNL